MAELMGAFLPSQGFPDPDPDPRDHRHHRPSPTRIGTGSPPGSPPKHHVITEEDHPTELRRRVLRGRGGGGRRVADHQAHDRGRLRRQRDPLPNVTSRILAKVIEYCKKHVESAKSEDRTTEEDLKAWDAEFVKVDQATLFDLILAANYLNIKGLLDLTCQTVADMIKGKTPEEIRKTFNIKNDFTPEEEEDVRRENQWAFE
ncbi:hypothetical protein NL676_006417 [Syzygium grande]|nr:hypothetical protein NL676_006417 [Syzygium grande]